MSDEKLPAYAIANLRDVNLGAEIIRYMREIDSTLSSFGGEFLVHGGVTDVLEGDGNGDTVIIRFPDRASARAWYDSPGYRAILPLRLANSVCETVIVDGVKPGHSASEKVDELLGGPVIRSARDPIAR